MKLISLAFVLISFTTFGQQLKILEPGIGEPLDFSAEFIERFNSADALRKCGEVWARLTKEGRSHENLRKDESEILRYCSEVREDVWDIVGGGCSWYCGGYTKAITASSHLKAQGGNTYEARNVHDFSYKTAWVEGVEGYGIGEYLEYYFPAETPRITEIILVNGYVKSRTAWENNSRVKQLKVYYNDKPIAILNLKDVMANQHFSIDPIGHADRENYEALKKLPDWKLKFEILDVYKGKKFADTAITQIYFDGIDVH